jgi:type IV fimbrial biogenesis protein FimT
MSSQGSWRRGSGFTLIELMIVVAMLIVVLSLAAPMMRGFVLAQRTKAVAQDLMSDLLLARSEALTRNAVVDVIPAGADWRSGWTVTVGGSTLSARQSDSGSVVFENAPAAIRFGVFGRVQSPADRVRITLRPDQADVEPHMRRCLELDNAGRPRLGTGPCL